MTIYHVFMSALRWQKTPEHGRAGVAFMDNRIRAAIVARGSGGKTS